MSANTDDSDSDAVETKNYGLVGRVILFLIIAGPGSVLAFGLWFRTGIVASITAGMAKGDFTPMMIFALWLIGMIGSAVMIFKR